MLLLSTLLVATVSACHKSTPATATPAPQPPLSQAPPGPATTPPSKTVVATVNGVPIVLDEVYYFYRGDHGERLTPDMKDAALQKLIDQELVFQQGKALGLDDTEYHDRIRGLELQLLDLKRSEMKNLVYRRIASKVYVSEQQARDYFLSHRKQMVRRIRLRIWQFKDKAQAQLALKALRAGHRTSIPYYEPAPMGWTKVPFEWHPVVYGLEVGQISDVFVGQKTGIRLFQLVSSQKTGPVRFNDVKNTIMAELREQRASDAFQADVKKLEAKATIKRTEFP